ARHTTKVLPPETSINLTSAMLLFRVLLCIAAAPAIAPCAAGRESAASQPESVAPGIWRLHFGNPEPFTPTAFRSANIDKAGLRKMPATKAMPLDAAQISFQTSDRGCSVLLPMKSGESVYGFGLHTELFDMTQNGEGHAGRRVI